jgi:hypothetical protein
MTNPYPSSLPSEGAATFIVVESQPPLGSPYRGMCLVSDYDVRIDCVRLAVDGTGLRTTTPLPPEDPLVAKPVTVAGPPPTPECATCRSWELIR